MLTQDYLILRLFRLKAGEEWIKPGEGQSFVFLKGGTGRFITGTVTHRLAAGDVLVLSATIGGKIIAAERSELAFWCFSLSVEHLFPLFASNEICLLQNVTDGLKGAKLYASTTPLARECHRMLAEVPPQFNLDHRSQLLRVAAAILTVEFKTAQPQRIGFVRAEEHMIQVFERLSTPELLSLSVGELADKFGCSRRHLNRLFRQHFGVSVAALKMEMRLVKAVSLLRNPNAKVIRVAEDCGFNHLGLFNICFKRRFGTSPGQWRKTGGRIESKLASPAAREAGCPLQVTGLCSLTGKPQNGTETAREHPAQQYRRVPMVLTSADGMHGNNGGHKATSLSKVRVNASKGGPSENGA